MPGFTRRKFAGGAAATTITGNINASATSITIAAYTGWPNGSDPFYVVIDPGTAAEEKVLVTRTGSTDTTLNVVTSGRGVDGTTAASHSSGAAIFPVFTATDADEANTVASTLTTKGDLLVHTGSAHARQAVGSNNAVLVADSAQTNGVAWTTTPTLTLTNSTGLPVAGITASTSSALGVGSIELGHATDTTIARVGAGQISVEGVNVVTTSSTDTLTNKTLTNPVVNGAILDRSEENWNIVASAATGTIALDVLTASIWYYTSNATANHTINVRGDGSTTLSSLLNTGDSITVVWANTNGTTAYYPSAFQVDGSAITPKWQGGTAPTAGNASSIDVYTYVIVKTAATPTYTVFASQTQFK